ncbi:MAG: hypothetical protein CVV21_02410 [Candidatus Goldiibacteriota bacterium HGW-Goldbacteria-1]|jgi:hypothetical protein|nr:MAG: hypothetical protein CVV21_02410 [Candidatus Goldiibacteriota bacterium HGW-Goldbacteria-1]
MNNIMLVVSAAAGAVTAWIYLMLLKRTVLQITSGKSSAVLIFGYFLRIAICIICFAAVSWGNHLDRVLACLVGFSVVQISSIIRAGRQSDFLKSAGNYGNKS